MKLDTWAFDEQSQEDKLKMKQYEKISLIEKLFYFLSYANILLLKEIEVVLYSYLFSNC